MVGSQEYLTKPFTKDQLLQAVQQFGAVSQELCNDDPKSVGLDDSKTELLY